MEYADAEQYRKRSQVRRGLEEHPDARRLADWLRENGGADWDEYLDKRFPVS